MKNAKEETSINISVKRHVTWPVARVIWLIFPPSPAAHKSAISSLLVLKWFVLVSRMFLDCWQSLSKFSGGYEALPPLSSLLRSSAVPRFSRLLIPNWPRPHRLFAFAMAKHSSKWPLEKKLAASSKSIFLCKEGYPQYLIIRAQDLIRVRAPFPKVLLVFRPYSLDAT